MKDLKAIIFDLDGVLVNTIDLHYKSWQKVAQYLDFELSVEIKDKFRGASRLKSLNLVLEEGRIDSTNVDAVKLCELKNLEYQKILDKEIDDILLPGVLKLINEIHSSDIKSAVASASKNAKIIINKLNLNSYFNVILDANDVLKTKPEPDIFTTVTDTLNLSPSCCLVIEDSPLGTQAAKNGGFKSLGVGPLIKESQADYILEDLRSVNLNKIKDIFKLISLN